MRYPSYKSLVPIYRKLKEWEKEKSETDQWENTPRVVVYECKMCNSQLAADVLVPGELPKAMDCPNNACEHIVEFKGNDSVRKVDVTHEFYRPTLQELQKKRKKLHILDWAFESTGLSIRKLKQNK